MNDRRPARTRALGRLGAVSAAVIMLAALAPAVAARGPSPVLSASASPPIVPVETTTYACGGYTLTIVNRHDALTLDPPAEPLPSLTVTAPDGTVVAEWKASDLTEGAFYAWCRDVTADGTLELGYSLFSGGGHCCFTFVVLHLKAPETELLRVNLHDVNRVTPRQLDRTPAHELVAADYRLAYMGDLPFAVTSPFPRVFAYRGGRYVEATRSFPAYLRADRKKALRDLAACGDDALAGSRLECERAVGLRIVALDILLRAPTSGISRLPLDLATRRWLLSMRAEVRRALANP